MKLILLLFLAIGCTKEPITKTETDNSEYEVSLLFNHDGCRVYRFWDRGWVYFSDCKGRIERRVSCGKNCTEKVMILNGGR